VKKSRKLALHRDTVRTLSGSALTEANGAGYTIQLCIIQTVYITCGASCNCVTHGCPTQAGDCTAAC
jgi:hypothetical protein